MILPLGDSPNPRGVPVVTYALVLANVAVYVVISLPLSGMPVDPADGRTATRASRPSP